MIRGTSESGDDLLVCVLFVSFFFFFFFLFFFFPFSVSVLCGVVVVVVHVCLENLGSAEGRPGAFLVLE